MGFCTSCGSKIADAALYCPSCGNKRPAPAGMVDVVPSSGPLYYVTYATGQTGGPFSEEAVKGMISRQEIKITDSVAMPGGSAWVPITQSPFAPFIAVQAGMSRLAASTCPRCGAAMAVFKKTPRMAIIFISVGIFTSIALIGILFLVIGWSMRRNASVGYRCPRCNYSSI